MWKKWTALGFFAALVLAGCGNGVNQLPGDQLGTAEDSVNTQASTLLNDAIAAFDDVLPAGFAPQATSTEPPPLTLAYNGEETVLIGGPWRPPFPWPLPNGVNDLDGKPLFITIKQASPRPPKAYVARLQKNERGEWEVAWYGEKGAPPEIRPATVEQVGEFGDATAPEVSITFSYKQWAHEVRKEISTFKIRTCDTTEAGRSCSYIHVTAPLPQDLQGREVSSNATPDVESFVNKLKAVCCGIKKPFPPNWPPLILLRNDVSVAVVPYDNPKVRDAQSLEDLLGQDIGFVYVRKKPIPGGTTTDCGPNGVWCPPREEPFYNLRVIEQEGNTYVQLTKLSDTSQVVATLPAQVVAEPSAGREIGITDSIDSPNEPALRIRWPNITITIAIKLPR